MEVEKKELKEEEWSGGEGSSDRDEVMGGVQSKVPIPGPLPEIQAVERVQGGGVQGGGFGDDGVEYGEFADLQE